MQDFLRGVLDAFKNVLIIAFVLCFAGFWLSFYTRIIVTAIMQARDAFNVKQNKELFHHGRK